MSEENCCCSVSDDCCGTTASMLSNTRYSKAFKVLGDRSAHYGIFGECGSECGNDDADTGTGTCC